MKYMFLVTPYDMSHHISFFTWLLACSFAESHETHANMHCFQAMRWILSALFISIKLISVHQIQILKGSYSVWTIINT